MQFGQHPHLIEVVDSHTAGEPTRVVISGGPDLGNAPLAQRVECFRSRFDHYRSAIVNEPRGSDVLVGALLVEPCDKSCATGVIFFNNVGYLGMCGHGIIGLVVTLAHLGRVSPGENRIETQVGVVNVLLKGSEKVTVENVVSFRGLKHVEIDVPKYGRVRGDVAWGGNWFFLVDEQTVQLSLANVDALTERAYAIRKALSREGITGTDGSEIDHIELFAAPQREGADSKNFVLCPGKAYDRSPCGTGTSAKMACLYADGKLKPGETWLQESILGTLFEGSIRLAGEKIIPSITGEAYVICESQLVFQPSDPFRWGVR